MRELGNTSLPVRKNLRLDSWNYAAKSAYFITICTKNREHLFWDEESALPYHRRGAQCAPAAAVPLNATGRLVRFAIQQIPSHYSTVSVDRFVIMPNHIHMILWIQQEEPSAGRTLCAPTVSRIVKQLKGAVTKQLGYSVWQRSFYDHILRNEDDYLLTVQYIDENPLKWELDPYHTPAVQRIP